MNFLNFLTSKANCNLSFIPSIQFWFGTPQPQFSKTKHYFSATIKPEIKQSYFTSGQGIARF